jgi:hypothetical protein
LVLVSIGANIMRKIEQDTLRAIREKRNWASGNMKVQKMGNVMAVFLHGNHIADINEQGETTVNVGTLLRYPTVTTKSRLRALGVNVYTKNYDVYLYGEKL